MADYKAPVQFPESALLQAREAVLAAAAAYLEVEQDKTCGSTAKAAYWGTYTTALGAYADAHAELFDRGPALAAMAGTAEVQDAGPERLFLLATLALRAAQTAGSAPSHANKEYYRIAAENLLAYVGRIKNGLPRPASSAPIVSRETYTACGAPVWPANQACQHNLRCTCVLPQGHKSSTHYSND